MSRPAAGRSARPAHFSALVALSCALVCFTGGSVASSATDLKLSDLTAGFSAAALPALTAEPRSCGALRGNDRVTVYVGDGAHAIDKATVAQLCGPGGLKMPWVFAQGVPQSAQRMRLLGRS